MFYFKSNFYKAIEIKKYKLLFEQEGGDVKRSASRSSALANHVWDQVKVTTTFSHFHCP